jgi:hypothetical protein
MDAGGSLDIGMHSDVTGGDWVGFGFRVIGRGRRVVGNVKGESLCE